VRCLRTNMGADQDAYESVHHMEDAEGKLGVRLQMSLVEVAGKALRANIVQLAPSILPVREIVKVALDLARRKLFVLRRGGGGEAGDKSGRRRPPAYEPDFKQAIDHFCIHPGGRAVIASIGKGLKLDSYHIEPGKMALHRFGNTSSSGIWYALAYCEAQGRLKKGHKVWQIALGSGFKCNSGVWRVLRDIDPVADDAPHGCNPWLSCIHRYPVVVSDTASASASASASAPASASASQEEDQRSSSSSSLNLPQPPPPPSSSMATPATTSG
jgi:3-ketoacyl-CoA synthase